MTTPARVDFIPWTFPHCEFFKASLKWRWQNLKDEKKWRWIVHYGKHWCPTIGLLTNGEIHVVGHGDQNDGNIYASTNGANPLQYDEVADRLITAGLRTSYRGEIVLSSCWSNHAGANSFGAQFANYMRAKGYNGCTYYGYNVEISRIPFPGGGNERYINDAGASGERGFATKHQL